MDREYKTSTSPYDCSVYQLTYQLIVARFCHYKIVYSCFFTMHLPLWARFALPTMIIRPSGSPGTFALQVTNGTTCYVDPSDAHRLQLPRAFIAGADEIRIYASATYPDIPNTNEDSAFCAKQWSRDSSRSYDHLWVRPDPSSHENTQRPNCGTNVEHSRYYYSRIRNGMTVSASLTFSESRTVIPASTTTTVVITVPSSTSERSPRPFYDAERRDRSEGIPGAGCMLAQVDMDVPSLRNLA